MLAAAGNAMGAWQRRLEYCRQALDYGQATNDLRLKVAPRRPRSSPASSSVGLGPHATLALILVAYFVLGCVLDPLAMIVLTVPIVFPVIVSLGFDPIWFGIIVVISVEMALITPPLGMNIYVMNSVVRDVSLLTIFKGVLPFVVTDIVRLTLIVVIPSLALWLPAQMG